MRNLLSAAVVTLTTASSAFAADLPMKAPPASSPLFSWTGCYVGANLGGVVSEDRTTNRFGNTISFSSAGFV